MTVYLVALLFAFVLESGGETARVQSGPKGNTIPVTPYMDPARLASKAMIIMASGKGELPDLSAPAIRAALKKQGQQRILEKYDLTMASTRQNLANFASANPFKFQNRKEWQDAAAQVVAATPGAKSDTSSLINDMAPLSVRQKEQEVLDKLAAAAYTQTVKLHFMTHPKDVEALDLNQLNQPPIARQQQLMQGAIGNPMQQNWPAQAALAADAQQVERQRQQETQDRWRKGQEDQRVQMDQDMIKLRAFQLEGRIRDSRNNTHANYSGMSTEANFLSQDAARMGEHGAARQFGNASTKLRELDRAQNALGNLQNDSFGVRTDSNRREAERDVWGGSGSINQFGK